MQIGNFENVQKVKKHVKENGPYDNTKNGKCSQCGECCGNILPMTKKEVQDIRKYITKNNIKEYKRVVPLANPILDLTCPFLDDNKKTEKCRIYEVRPFICRHFVCNMQKDKFPKEFFENEYEAINVRETFFR